MPQTVILAAWQIPHDRTKKNGVRTVRKQQTGSQVVKESHSYSKQTPDRYITATAQQFP